jgi:DNA-binding response OmpR family regulator
MVRRGDAHEEPGRADAAARRSALPGIAAFGAFRLGATERVLKKDGVPLKIGSRALDILVTLAERAPEVVSNRDLMACVWGIRRPLCHEYSRPGLLPCRAGDLDSRRPDRE